jgi:hypothetical protein
MDQRDIIRQKEAEDRKLEPLKKKRFTLGEMHQESEKQYIQPQSTSTILKLPEGI